MPAGLGGLKPWVIPEAGSCAVELDPWGGALFCDAALSIQTASLREAGSA